MIPLYITCHVSSITYIATEFVVDSELLQANALLLLFLKKSLDTGCLLFISTLAILRIAELYLSRDVLPLAISILENVLVGLVNEVAV
jgi:hypothetical protein